MILCYSIAYSTCSSSTNTKKHKIVTFLCHELTVPDIFGIRVCFSIHLMLQLCAAVKTEPSELRRSVIAEVMKNLGFVHTNCLIFGLCESDLLFVEV